MDHNSGQKPPRFGSCRDTITEQSEYRRRDAIARQRNRFREGVSAPPRLPLNDTPSIVPNTPSHHNSHHVSHQSLSPTSPVSPLPGSSPPHSPPLGGSHGGSTTVVSGSTNTKGSLSGVVQSPAIVQHEISHDPGFSGLHSYLRAHTLAIESKFPAGSLPEALSASSSISARVSGVSRSSNVRFFLSLADESPPSFTNLPIGHAVVLSIHSYADGAVQTHRACTQHDAAPTPTLLVSRHGHHAVAHHPVEAVIHLLLALQFFATDVCADMTTIETVAFRPSRLLSTCSSPVFRIVFPMPDLETARCAVFTTLEASVSDGIIVPHDSSPCTSPVNNAESAKSPAFSFADADTSMMQAALHQTFDTTDIAKAVPLFAGHLVNSGDVDMLPARIDDDEDDEADRKNKKENTQNTDAMSIECETVTMTDPQSQRSTIPAPDETIEASQQASTIMLSLTPLLSTDEHKSALSSIQEELTRISANAVTCSSRDANSEGSEENRVNHILRVLTASDRMALLALHALNSCDIMSKPPNASAVTASEKNAAAICPGTKLYDVLCVHTNVANLITNSVNFLAAQASPAWRLHALDKLAESTVPLVTLKDIRRAFWTLTRLTERNALAPSLIAVERAMGAVRSLINKRKEDEKVQQGQGGDRNEHTNGSQPEGMSSQVASPINPTARHANLSGGNDAAHRQLPTTSVSFSSAVARSTPPPPTGARGVASTTPRQVGLSRANSTGLAAAEQSSGFVGGFGVGGRSDLINNSEPCGSNVSADACADRGGGNGTDGSKRDQRPAKSRFVKVDRRLSARRATSLTVPTSARTPSAGTQPTPPNPAPRNSTTQAAASTISGSHTSHGLRTPPPMTMHSVPKRAVEGGLERQDGSSQPKRTGKRLRFLRGDVTQQYAPLGELAIKLEVRSLFRDGLVPSGLMHASNTGANSCRDGDSSWQANENGASGKLSRFSEMGVVREQMLQERLCRVSGKSTLVLMAWLTELIRRIRCVEHRCAAEDDADIWIDLRVQTWRI